MSIKWRPVVGFEEFYEVSNDGRVRATPEGAKRRRRHSSAELAFHLNDKGYRKCELWRAGKMSRRFVHCLILEAFVGPRPTGQVTRHLNGDKLDNRPENLAWGTAKQNSADRIAHGNVPCGEKAFHSKLTQGQVDFIRSDAASQLSLRELARLLGVSNTTVCHVRQGKTWVDPANPTVERLERREHQRQWSKRDRAKKAS